MLIFVSVSESSFKLTQLVSSWSPGHFELNFPQSCFDFNLREDISYEDYLTSQPSEDYGKDHGG